MNMIEALKPVHPGEILLEEFLMPLEIVQVIADEHAAGVPPNTVNFSIRLPVELAAQMSKAAAAEHLRTSAWLCRLITDALSSDATPNDAHIERVGRRILAEHKIA